MTIHEALSLLYVLPDLGRSYGPTGFELRRRQDIPIYVVAVALMSKKFDDAPNNLESLESLIEDGKKRLRRLKPRTFLRAVERVLACSTLLKPQNN